MTLSNEIVEQIRHLPLQEKTTLVKIIMEMIEKDHQDSFSDLQAASVSSTDFWDNPIDDEVWNED